MKKLVLTLALVFGVLAANAQYFVGGQFGLLYDDASENTMITIAPEFGYAFNDTWTVAGMIGYTHMDNFNSFYIAPYARWNFWKKDFVGLLVDGGFGISTQKYKGADSDTGFEIGFKPGISFNLTDNFSLVAHYGFLGYRTKYNGSSVSGLSLSRATLANWIIYCAENYLCHVYDYFHRQLRMRKYLMADETRVQVLNEPERNPETDSWMWLFRSGEDGLPPILLYHYTETRAKFHAASFLQGFRGYLETDGYQGYNNLPDIKRCSCWAHVRRYFTDAIPKGKEYDYSLPAVQGVQFCSKLFDCERYSKAKNHTAEQRKQFRLEKEKPILEAFWIWLDQQRPNKGTRLAKAVNYAQNRKDTLMTYLEDGHCSLSNNLSENAIRPFTVGRRNWLFSASPKGAASSAIVYTMVEMAKANDLNTYKYLTYLLSQRPDDKMSDEQLEQLAPWSETAKANCQN